MHKTGKSTANDALRSLCVSFSVFISWIWICRWAATTHTYPHHSNMHVEWWVQFFAIHLSSAWKIWHFLVLSLNWRLMSIKLGHRTNWKRRTHTHEHTQIRIFIFSDAKCDLNSFNAIFYQHHSSFVNEIIFSEKSHVIWTATSAFKTENVSQFAGEIDEIFRSKVY